MANLRISFGLAIRPAMLSRFKPLKPGVKLGRPCAPLWRPGWAGPLPGIARIQMMTTWMLGEKMNAAHTGQTGLIGLIGLIGLGTMGAGMAQSLRKAGVALHVFDRRAPNQRRQFQ